MARKWLQLIELLERRQANLALLLASFAVCFSLDSIEAHLLCVRVLRHAVAIASPPSPRWTTPDAAPADGVEAAGEEQEEPGSESEPDGHADLCLASIDGIDTRLGEEEEYEIEDESDECDGCCKPGHAGTAVGHRHLTNMSEEAEDGGDGGEAEGDDVQDEGVGEPFDDDVGDLDGEVVADEGVDVCTLARKCGGSCLVITSSADGTGTH